MTNFRQIPSKSFPVYIIGAGSIVNDAHLPAYKLAGFDVQGIFDLFHSRATETAEKFGIPKVFASLDDMLAQATGEVVFDVAVPGSSMLSVIDQLPDKSNVLLQKPMGEDLSAARKIRSLTRDKKMTAAVNFQLRYSPDILEVRNMLQQGLLGDLLDIEVNVNVYTPWQLWDFLFKAPRVELLYHSIHYIDLVRSFLGNPFFVYAKTVKHPAMKSLASVRSTIIMDYGAMIRVAILTNHCHVYGEGRQQSYIKFEGTKGAVKLHLGSLINYPHGAPDRFEYTVSKNGGYSAWKTKAIEGSWFPHAFIGSMRQVMLAAEGSITRPDNSVEDAIHTMACVEAAYHSSEQGGIKPAFE